MVKQGIVLGHVISERGIEADKAKVETVEWTSAPENGFKEQHSCSLRSG
jgi:hypothetical protein